MYRSRNRYAKLTEQRICAILRTHLFEKHNASLQAFSHTISEQLSQIQTHLFEQAQARLSATQCPLLVDKNALHTHFSANNPGPALIYWTDNNDEENQLQSQYKKLACGATQILSTFLLPALDLVYLTIPSLVG